MQMNMPLGYDMEKQCLRRIEAKFPEDLTQEEFWDFVCLVGAGAFGERKEEGEGKESSEWNISGSFNHFVGEKYGN